MTDTSLAVDVAGLRMTGPCMLAGGVLGRSVPILRRAIQAGAGGAVTSSQGIKQMPGWSNPIAIPLASTIEGKQVPTGYINAVGFENNGIDAFLRELELFRAENLPIVVSVYSSHNPTDSDSQKRVDAREVFGELARRAVRSPAKAVELNLSSPNTPQAGLDIGDNVALVAEIVCEVKRATKGTGKPFFVKLSPTINNIVEIARIAEIAGADGIVACNTAKGMVIDIDSGRPVLTFKTGGVSGPLLKPIAVRCVYDISRKVEIPVIGCGGIVRWEDAVEYILAGASAVQVGVGLTLRFPRDHFRLFKEINQGILQYMERKGVGRVSEMVGMAHRRGYP